MKKLMIILYFNKCLVYNSDTKVYYVYYDKHVDWLYVDDNIKNTRFVNIKP